MRFVKSILTNPANFNNYIYSIQNPLRYSDSTGLACGPGWLGDIIIDDYRFESCCQKHDNCYAGKGSERCKKRKDCDKEFCDCMTATCDKAWDRGKCRMKADRYCRWVKMHGSTHYTIRSCDCPNANSNTKK